MARGTRSPRNDTAGPGRPTRRTRAGSRASGPDTPSEPPPRDRRDEVPVWRRGLHVTRRAIVLILVVVALVISFGGSLRGYLAQQHELAVAEQEIRDRSAQIADLEAELARWDDPDYVKAQARDRLGWVMPGETGYRVIGADGKPIGGGVVIESAEKLPAGEHEPVWWDRLWGSMQAADAPARKVTSP
ncbi:MAG TPA: septum formation initiator family protein [Propionicimonas sp.]|nr:septum formation initiator family protein [Propionicimonas sp.]HQA77360.1 septum formation initiator family protein [Propionicimonas sp.]HQD97080.1 septum formation initiator family protein [Propionicimonas sp.]